MEKIENKSDGCAHTWKNICAVYYPKANKDGKAMQCMHCYALAFREETSKPKIVSGRDLYQIEFTPDGRLSPVMDAHL